VEPWHGGGFKLRRPTNEYGWRVPDRLYFSRGPEDRVVRGLFEEPAASDRAGGEQCIGRMRRIGEEHPVEPEIGKVGGDGGVLAYTEVGVDSSG
jgi:hypothetical protein